MRDSPQGHYIGVLDMDTRFSIERIDALMGSALPRDYEADLLATWVIDGILDNEDLNGPGT